MNAHWTPVIRSMRSVSKDYTKIIWRRFFLHKHLFLFVARLYTLVLLKLHFGKKVFQLNENPGVRSFFLNLLKDLLLFKIM